MGDLLNGAFELLELPLILRRKTLAFGSLADVESACNISDGPQCSCKSSCKLATYIR